MKLADFFINIGVVGDTKELDKTIKRLEEANTKEKRRIQFRDKIVKLNKMLEKAETDEQKAKIKQLKIAERDNYVNQIKIDKLKKQKEGLIANKEAFMGAVKGIGAFIAAASLAYKVIDHMVGSLSKANQQMITFQRTTGISFASLNKYASANAAVNYNSTIEGTAQSMARVAQNLWDIRMGRGDISPYQELAYVGGKAFNPMGMSVEQVIESVREAIRGVDDLQATNIITRMGFAPDDLLMLRMSREEFEKINSMFLNPEQREAMNKYALQLKKTQLQFNLLKEKSLLKIMPLFVELSKWLTQTATLWGNVANKIINVVNASETLQTVLKRLGSILLGAFIWFHPIIGALTAIYLIIEDIAGYFMGYKSVTGFVVNHLLDFFDELGEKLQTSKVTAFFGAFAEGLKMLAGLQLPAWLQGLFVAAFGNPNWFNDLNSANSNYTPSTSNNTVNNTTNNNSMNTTINTNQSLSSVLGSIKSVAFPQMQLAQSVRY